MSYLALANLTVALHLAFVLFVALGGLLVVWRPKLSWAHLPAVGWGVLVELTGWTCPLTVVENLRLPLELNGRKGRREDARVAALLERVGLAERAGSFPDRLSGGEQQRVAVARALVHDPLLVLADEPTGNLDAETAEDVLRLLDTLTRGAGKTMLVVTHSPRVVELADRVLTIHGHRLVEEPAR